MCCALGHVLCGTVCVRCLSCFYVVCICIVLGQCLIRIMGLRVHSANVYIICAISIVCVDVLCECTV